MKFEKNYTRDTTLIMQQLWAQELSLGFAEKRGLKNPYAPIIIHYLIEGSVEIWENAEAISWLRAQLLEINTKSDASIRSDLEEYLKILAQVKEYWAKDSVENMADFKRYLDLVRRGLFLFNVWYYTVTNPKTSQAIIDPILAIRKDDMFFSRNDILISKILKGLYPNLGGLETAMLLHEIENPPERSVLELRAQGAAIMDGDNLFVGKHEAFQKQYPEIEFQGEFAEEGATSVKGQVAFKGKCQGIVRVLRRRDQIAKVKEGDIIVSPMTTPDLLPAMEKAAAFVTDEGGITCHAAIVAREMKKPCVIGTKVATQVFKDGDVVEVDANIGVVKII